ncbi:hypothetical protein [Leptospira interrogans]|uniref:hypothetical protein n=1 Tax=Leptospira interrogans TaxID=173 RepID=UPI00046C8B2F|nr:hypothetical protein [Leptospira interrogans]
MLIRIKQYKTRFLEALAERDSSFIVLRLLSAAFNPQNAVSIFGIVAFAVLFCLNWGFERSVKIVPQKLASVLEWSFDSERKLELSSFEILEKPNELFLEDNFRKELKNQKLGFKNKNERLTNVLLYSVKNKESEKLKTVEFHLEIILKKIIPVFTNQPVDISNIELAIEPNSAINLETIDSTWETNAELSATEKNEFYHPQKVLILGQIKEIGLSDLQIKNEPENIQKNSISWEFEKDTFEIRILENIHIEKWTWKQIQEKLEEIKSVKLQNNIPSFFAGAKERLLYLPRRTQPNLKNYEITSLNPDYIWKYSNFLILDHSLEAPNLNRKLMRYYSIQMNGPPPGNQLQV